MSSGRFRNVLIVGGAALIVGAGLVVFLVTRSAPSGVGVGVCEDDTGDVRYVNENPASGRPEVDIERVELARENDMLVARFTMGAARDEDGGAWIVSVQLDDERHLVFSQHRDLGEVSYVDTAAQSSHSVEHAQFDLEGRQAIAVWRDPVIEDLPGEFGWSPSAMGFSEEPSPAPGEGGWQDSCPAKGQFIAFPDQQVQPDDVQAVASPSIPVSSASPSIQAPSAPPSPTPMETAAEVNDEDSLVLRGGGLGNVDFGVESEEAIAKFSDLLGDPAYDTGWIESDYCEEMSRQVSWGNLTIELLRAGPSGSGEFAAWMYGPLSPGLASYHDLELENTEGLSLGATTTELRTTYGDEIEFYSGEGGALEFSLVDPATGDYASMGGVIGDDSTVIHWRGGLGCNIL